MLLLCNLIICIIQIVSFVQLMVLLLLKSVFNNNNNNNNKIILLFITKHQDDHLICPISNDQPQQFSLVYLLL
ncbi:hypothetical protein QVD17_22551 [Tagetes erecta]|uniref:Uncharacterized protein n=1 Tax=Tagetes erecta TaxID=13708 RepID=A0AAD8NTN1_TARER|nr:hypothetical protein QVD17_22551 [Tagetes erecta]